MDSAAVFSASHTFIRDWYGTSRLFASILMLSRSEAGSRRELLAVTDDRLCILKTGKADILPTCPVFSCQIDGYDHLRSG